MNLKVFDLGLSDFKQALTFQKEIFNEVKNGRIESALIICQHHPVITLGRQAVKKNLLASQEELTKQKIEVCEIERGGDITYHGPGQITAYPIFDLRYFKKDIHLFLRYLEGAIAGLLLDLGIKAVTYPGLTGVWINKAQKIASIGITVKNWITFHGLSLNVKTDDLENFRLIKPCGMDIEMVSLETILARPIDINQVKQGLIAKLKTRFSSNRNPLTERIIACSC